MNTAGFLANKLQLVVSAAWDVRTQRQGQWEANGDTVVPLLSKDGRSLPGAGIS